MMISDLDNKSNSSSGSSHTHEQLYGMSTPSNVEIVNSKSGIETILPFKKTLNPKIHDCPYPDCNKSFHCKSRLSDHINSHTGERPYTCCFVGCTRTFTSSASLYQHHKLKHGMMTMPSIAAPHLSHHVLERKENRRRSSSMFSGVVGVGVGGGGGGGASMNLCDLCKRSCNMLQQSPHHHGISTPPISASDAANGSSSTSSSSKTTTLVLLPPPSAAAHLYLPAATKIIPSSASATASASAAASLAPHLSAASHHFSAPVSSSHHHIHRHPQQHRQHSSFMRVDALPPYYQHPHQYDMSMSYAAAAGTPYSHCDSSSNYASPMSHCSTTSSSSTSSSEANSTTTTTTTPTTTTSSVTPTTSAMATAAGSNMIIRSSQPSSSPSFVQINRDYICPYIECSKRFNQKTNLVNHIRTHTGERPYMCALETCKKSFTQLAALNSHQLTHMTGRSFTCPTCKKAFKNANYLDKHMLIHSLSIQNNNAEHRIMNESKSSSSDENNNDSAHKSAETDKQDSFVCLMCPNLVFERSEHLAEHLANHKSQI